MNCKPGDLAIVVNDDQGCECNIGALLTVTEPGEPCHGEWGFTNASRPLKIIPGRGCPDQTIIWTTEGDRGASDPYYYTFKDRDLRPFRAPDITDKEVRDLYAAPPRPGLIDLPVIDMADLNGGRR